MPQAGCALKSGLRQRRLASRTTPGSGRATRRYPAFLYIFWLRVLPAPVTSSYDVTAGRRGGLDRSEQHPPQPPTLQVRRDHQSADVPRPVDQARPHGPDQPAGHARHQHRVAGRPGHDVAQRLAQRGDLDVRVVLLLGDPAGTLQGVQLAGVRGRDRTQLEVVDQLEPDGPGRVDARRYGAAPARGARWRSRRGRRNAARWALPGRATSPAWCRRGTRAGRPRGTPRPATRGCP